jgi:uncharacterized C2H2 Zn-finger protein
VQKARDKEIASKSFNYECPECGDLFKAPRPLAKHCGRYDCSFMAQGRKTGDYESSSGYGSLTWIGWSARGGR